MKKSIISTLHTYAFISLSLNNVSILLLSAVNFCLLYFVDFVAKGYIKMLTCYPFGWNYIKDRMTCQWTNIFQKCISFLWSFSQHYSVKEETDHEQVKRTSWQTEDRSAAWNMFFGRFLFFLTSSLLFSLLWWTV